MDTRVYCKEFVGQDDIPELDDYELMLRGEALL